MEIETVAVNTRKAVFLLKSVKVFFCKCFLLWFFFVIEKLDFLFDAHLEAYPAPSDRPERACAVRNKSI